MLKGKNYNMWGKIILGFAIGLFVGGGAVFRKMTTATKYINNFFYDLERKYFRMEQISRLLEKEYYDKDLLSGSQNQMIDKATKAFVDGLGDPYSSYLDAEEYSGLQMELEGDDSIEGIGAVVSKKDYYIQVEEVVKNTPAYKEGLQPLDRIVLIGTGETKDLTTLEAVEKIRGEKGTSVFLLIERVSKTGEKEYLQKTVTRDVIDVPSVKSKIIEDEDYKLGYLEISIFGDQTNKIFTREISDLIIKKVDGIILDLRGNGGGLLTSAVDLAGHFIPNGEIVVKTKYSVLADTTFLSKGYGELEKKPLVVLIDGLSASSSEILAMALKEKINAKIVGKPSFGKGTIQTLYDFDDGSSLKYTIGRWYSPNGSSIDKEGIIPDVEVAFDFTGYVENGSDSQLLKAQDVLKEMIRKK